MIVAAPSLSAFATEAGWRPASWTELVMEVFSNAELDAGSERGGCNIKKKICTPSPTMIADVAAMALVYVENDLFAVEDK